MAPLFRTEGERSVSAARFTRVAPGSDGSCRPPASPRPRRGLPAWFRIEPSDLSFVDEAEFAFDNHAHVEAPPEAVYDALGDVRDLHAWVPLFASAEWLAGDDRVVGAVLEERFRFMTLRMRMVACDRGRRWASSVDACTLPLAARMLQLIELEPRGAGETSLRWRVCYTPLPAMRPLHPLVQPLFARFFRVAVARLAAHLRAARSGAVRASPG